MPSLFQTIQRTKVRIRVTDNNRPDSELSEYLCDVVQFHVQCFKRNRSGTTASYFLSILAATFRVDRCNWTWSIVRRTGTSYVHVDKACEIRWNSRAEFIILTTVEWKIQFKKFYIWKNLVSRMAGRWFSYKFLYFTAFLLQFLRSSTCTIFATRV